MQLPCLCTCIRAVSIQAHQQGANMKPNLKLCAAVPFRAPDAKGVTFSRGRSLCAGVSMTEDWLRAQLSVG